jgi:pyrroloquinoline quinone biosynthesis protein B
MQREHALRGSGVKAVMLTDSQIDHTTGLLTLRESDAPLELYCTESAYEDLTSGFPVISMLAHYCGVNPRGLALEHTTNILVIEHIQVTLLALRSKAPRTPGTAT